MAVDVVAISCPNFAMIDVTSAALPVAITCIAAVDDEVVNTVNMLIICRKSFGLKINCRIAFLFDPCMFLLLLPLTQFFNPSRFFGS